MFCPLRCQDKEEKTLTVINVYCPRADPEKPERKQFKLQFYKLLQCRAEAVLKDGRYVFWQNEKKAQVFPAYWEKGFSTTIEFLIRLLFFDFMNVELLSTFEWKSFIICSLRIFNINKFSIHLNHFIYLKCCKVSLIQKKYFYFEGCVCT